MQAKITLRQAAQQALEALEPEWWEIGIDVENKQSKAAEALRAALAEPEQNPFGDDAERYARKLHEEREYYKALFTKHKPEQEPDGISWLKRDSGYFTAPTPRKPLTDEQISVLWDGHTVPVFDKTGINPIVFARAIERAHGIGEQT